MARDGRNRAAGRLKAVPTENDHGIVGQNGKCGAAKRSGPKKGEPCENDAGKGTDHPGYGACQYHGGNSPSLRRHAAKMQLREMAQEMDVEPDEAILKVVRIDYGMVEWLRNQIAYLEDGRYEEVHFVGQDVDRHPELVGAIYRDELRTWLDSLAKHSKLALDAGIAERQMQILEAEAAIFATAVQGILRDLNLTGEQRAEAPAIVRRHLEALPVGA
jgi:hypothetical protein